LSGAVAFLAATCAGLAGALGAEGLLMPAEKDQAPPGLRYFGQSRK
jgi:hypothetical protein